MLTPSLHLEAWMCMKGEDFNTVVCLASTAFMFLCFSPSQVPSQSSQASIHTVVYLSSMLCPRAPQGGGMSWRLSSRILRLLLGTESLREYQHQHPFISQLQVLATITIPVVINLLWIWVYYGQLLNSKCLGLGLEARQFHAQVKI